MSSKNKSKESYIQFNELYNSLRRRIRELQTVDEDLIAKILKCGKDMKDFLNEKNLVPIVDPNEIKNWSKELDNYNTLVLKQVRRQIPLYDTNMVPAVIEPPMRVFPSPPPCDPTPVLIDSGSIEGGETHWYQISNQVGQTMNSDTWGNGLPYGNIAFVPSDLSGYPSWGHSYGGQQYLSWVSADQDISRTLTGAQIKRNFTLRDLGPYLLKFHSQGYTGSDFNGPELDNVYGIGHILTIDQYLRVVPPVPPNFPLRIFSVKKCYASLEFGSEFGNYEEGPAYYDGVTREIILYGPGEVKIVETFTYTLERSTIDNHAWAWISGQFHPLEWRLYRLPCRS